MAEYVSSVTDSNFQAEVIADQYAELYRSCYAESRSENERKGF